ncbi:MAG: hypothetical protein ACE5KX_01625 [Acidimicrobiia bacterium]
MPEIRLAAWLVGLIILGAPRRQYPAGATVPLSQLLPLPDLEEPDLPCPWCQSPTAEDDESCPTCGRAFRPAHVLPSRRSAADR